MNKNLFGVMITKKILTYTIIDTNKKHKKAYKTLNKQRAINIQLSLLTI